MYATNKEELVQLLEGLGPDAQYYVQRCHQGSMRTLRPPVSDPTTPGWYQDWTDPYAVADQMGRSGFAQVVPHPDRPRAWLVGFYPGSVRVGERGDHRRIRGEIRAEARRIADLQFGIERCQQRIDRMGQELANLPQPKRVCLAEQVRAVAALPGISKVEVRGETRGYTQLVWEMAPVLFRSRVWFAISSPLSLALHLESGSPGLGYTDDRIHPHISGETLCAGNGRQAIEAAVSSGQLAVAVDLFRMLMLGLNEGDMYNTDWARRGWQWYGDRAALWPADTELFDSESGQLVSFQAATGVAFGDAISLGARMGWVTARLVAAPEKVRRCFCGNSIFVQYQPGGSSFRARGMQCNGCGQTASRNWRRRSYCLCSTGRRCRSCDLPFGADYDHGRCELETLGTVEDTSYEGDEEDEEDTGWACDHCGTHFTQGEWEDAGRCAQWPGDGCPYLLCPDGCGCAVHPSSRPEDSHRPEQCPGCNASMAGVQFGARCDRPGCTGYTCPSCGQCGGMPAVEGVRRYIRAATWEQSGVCFCGNRFCPTGNCPRPSSVHPEEEEALPATIRCLSCGLQQARDTWAVGSERCASAGCTGWVCPNCSRCTLCESLSV